jgi:alkylhydroperoxidase family enzyme
LPPSDWVETRRPCGRARRQLYVTIMFGPSSVTRLEREAIAVAVSTANRCHY